MEEIEDQPEEVTNPENGNSKDIAITVKNLVKIYKLDQVEVFALRGLNAKFYHGEVAIIEGPSGCGKSTLVNIIGGLDRQSAGEVIFYDSPRGGKESKPNPQGGKEKNRDPQDLIDAVSLRSTKLSELGDTELEEFRRDHTGIVFQFMNLIPTLTAVENVALPLLFQGVSDTQRTQRALDLLAQVKLQDRARHKPGQMSGGEQQRVAIAAALINNPTVIIADEPTGNLDTKTAEEVIDFFRHINQTYPDKTVIIVSHDRAFRRIANRILFIKDGVIIDEQAPEGLAKEMDNLAPTVQDEIQKYQQHIIELERKLRRMEEIFHSK